MSQHDDIPKSVVRAMDLLMPIPLEPRLKMFSMFLHENVVTDEIIEKSVVSPLIHELACIAKAMSDDEKSVMHRVFKEKGAAVPFTVLDTESLMSCRSQSIISLFNAMSDVIRIKIVRSFNIPREVDQCCRENEKIKELYTEIRMLSTKDQDHIKHLMQYNAMSILHTNKIRSAPPPYLDEKVLDAQKVKVGVELQFRIARDFIYEFNTEIRPILMHWRTVVTTVSTVDVTKKINAIGHDLFNVVPAFSVKIVRSGDFAVKSLTKNYMKTKFHKDMGKCVAFLDSIWNQWELLNNSTKSDMSNYVHWTMSVVLGMHKAIYDGVRWQYLNPTTFTGLYHVLCFGPDLMHKQNLTNHFLSMYHPDRIGYFGQFITKMPPSWLSESVRTLQIDADMMTKINASGDIAAKTARFFMEEKKRTILKNEQANKKTHAPSVDTAWAEEEGEVVDAVKSETHDD